MASSLPPITRFFQQCEPTESMRPDDPRWVYFDEVRGEENVVKDFVGALQQVRFSIQLSR